MTSTTTRAHDAVANAARGLANAALQMAPRPEWVLLELDGPLPERREPETLLQRFAHLGRHALSVASLAERLDRLAAAPGLRGVVVRLLDPHLSTSKAWTVRELLADVRRRGKQVVVWTDHLGTASYLVATAADRIAAPEGAEFDVRGMALEVSFLKDLLDRVGISFDVETMGEYKAAADHLRRSRMSGPHREMLDALLDSLWGDVVAAIAAGRNLTTAAVAALVDEAPLSAREARDHGLIDEVLWEDELAHWLGGGAPVRLLPWERALPLLAHRKVHHAHKTIAVVPVHGAIVSGRSRRLPVGVPLLGQQAGAETVVRSLRAAARDRSVGAVVLLVDSPGGSALASEQIWREVVRVRRTKPVVAWMGDVAASGGYYVAAAADAIVAQPTTLTGSIGVIAAKPVAAGLRDQMGVHVEALSRGRMAGLFTSSRPFDDGERERVRTMLERTYGRFKGAVAEGRHLDLDAVEGLARGRVWTGRQGLSLGLVDELGGMGVAVKRAMELAHIPADRQPVVLTAEPPRGALAPPTDAASILAGLHAAWIALEREVALTLLPPELIPPSPPAR